MPDLNLHLDYFEHPKTVKTVALLGVGSDVLPIKLWKYCGKFHAADGRLLGYTPDAIESFCGWRGQKGKMVEVFLQIGWLHQIEGGFEVHDWGEHQGHLEAFSKRGKAANKARWDKIRATRTPSGIPDGPRKDSLAGPPSIPTIKTNGLVFPVEPPPGMPEDESRARFIAEKAGVPPEKGATYWVDIASRGWRDGLGNPVLDFGWHCKSRFNNEQNRMAQRKAASVKPSKPQADLPTVRAPK